MVQIEIIRFTERSKSYFQAIQSQVAQLNLKGDWLNDPPDFKRGVAWLHTCIDVIKNESKNRWKYGNPLRVVEKENEAWIEAVGIETDKIQKIVGFRKIA